MQEKRQSQVRVMRRPRDRIVQRPGEHRSTFMSRVKSSAIWDAGWIMACRSRFGLVRGRSGAQSTLKARRRGDTHGGRRGAPGKLDKVDAGMSHGWQ